MFGKLKALMDRRVGINLVTIKGFSGVMGSGKGYKCEQLKKEGFVQIDFADSLRDMAWKMLEWTPQNPEEYDLFKKGQISIPKYGKIDGRLLLQRLGATMREMNLNFWVEQWKRQVDEAISKGYDKICVSDMRYENELATMFSYNWKALVDVEFCDYHSERYNAESTHESEAFAQKLLNLGYKDGQKITTDILKD